LFGQTWYQHARRRITIACTLALLGAAIAAGPAQADAFGPQLQLTEFGPPGDAAFTGGFHDLAYNPATGQYLLAVVGSTDATNDDVYARLLDGAGSPVSGPTRVSETSIGDDEFNPASVAYNPIANEWLVAWTDATDDKVFVRRVAANGTPIGGEREISSGNTNDIETTVPVFSPEANEYLVVWKGNSSAVGRVKGQRLAADATEIGTNDFNILGSAALNTNDAVDVAYNNRDREYLVVTRARPASNEFEIYGQRLDLTGAEVGTDDFRISDAGPDGDATYTVFPPSVTYNPTLNQYLVGWPGEDNTGSLVNGEIEVFGQLLASNGVETGVNDFRISAMGPDGDTNYEALRPRIAYNPNANQWLVTWHGDTNVAPLVNDEREIFGQTLAADGALIGTPQFRISLAGTDGDPAVDGFRPAVAYNAGSCDFLVAYMIGDDSPDSEVYGRRVSAPACPLPPPPPPPPPPPGPNAGPCANPKTGTNASETINGTAFGDLISGLGGNDVISGLQGDDCLNGNAGRDRLSGASGVDRLSGGARRDRLSGGSGNDRLSGGSGNDRLSGGAGRDRLSGGAGKDRLSGGALSDRLSGGVGKDRLSGGARRDRLSGGSGNDNIAGGAGRNTYSAGGGNDVVNSANGRRERVNCGRGNGDRVRADDNDRLRGCEIVTRV
jgi:Ca2+-binding RTX toxin-like protein